MEVNNAKRSFSLLIPSRIRLKPSHPLHALIILTTVFDANYALFIEPEIGDNA